ncbi:RNA polymerase sigma factor [Aeromicrobium sp. HA]|uniref:RNA polymerase sigma factor n=1 Tax=Aeromicrobium sp. HA TaxID=3009077 RepID=UPI0022AF1312|nr:RNA polymerase sigma factor [Aeromicrobium sp. HA]
MDETDEGVWGRILAGDPLSFGVIWDRHKDRVFTHVLRGGATRHDAEDLAAMAFLELWRRRSHVTFVDGSVLPWLLVTTRNVARNAARSRRRFEKFLATLPPPVLIDDAARAISDHEDKRLTALRGALASLKPIDADLLAMTAIEGFSIREAALATGVSESAAKTRLSRLRRRLKSTATATLLPEGEPS